MNNEYHRNWLALLRLPQLGPRGFITILEHYPNLADFFEAKPWRVPQFTQDQCDFLDHPPWHDVDRDLAWAAQPRRHILTLDDPHYPFLLKQIADPPPVLYVEGDPQALSEPQIAIVGSRHPTPAGRQIAAHFAQHLAKQGFIITSGLALGIDTAAHEGALKTGRTLAVKGCGPDFIYPHQNRSLASKIIEKCAIVSEFWPGTPPHAKHFPKRNRIVSGLSLGTLVVEAALKSGSLITARLALEQDREVFAIPGSVHNPVARGCNYLIRQGAHLVESADDLLAVLNPLLFEPQNIPICENPNFPLAPQDKNLLKCIGFELTLVDQIISYSGLDASLVCARLVELELSGYILAVPGGYVRSNSSALHYLD